MKRAIVPPIYWLATTVLDLLWGDARDADEIADMREFNALCAEVATFVEGLTEGLFSPQCH